MADQELKNRVMRTLHDAGDEGLILDVLREELCADKLTLNRVLLDFKHEGNVEFSGAFLKVVWTGPVLAPELSIDSYADGEHQADQGDGWPAYIRMRREPAPKGEAETEIYWRRSWPLPSDPDWGHKSQTGRLALGFDPTNMSRPTRAAARLRKLQRVVAQEFAGGEDTQAFIDFMVGAEWLERIDTAIDVAIEGEPKPVSTELKLRIEPLRVDPREVEAHKVIQGLMEIAELAMSSGYFESDSRAQAARDFLGTLVVKL